MITPKTNNFGGVRQNLFFFLKSQFFRLVGNVIQQIKNVSPNMNNTTTQNTECNIHKYKQRTKRISKQLNIQN